eukprot:TRINITY_DN29132_c0_g1_i1.p1 TRINITY_DN29132_c0_g1~~TRINITY_DN29132_c0_g1_i1.p1  ORF type:complete len:260 (+),score=57.09 TRINITY_DN29132_c0_g1_i1:36-782(+)
MEITVEVDSAFFDIEVHPTDTIWSLKWKIFDNEAIRRRLHHRKGVLPPPPDVQLLVSRGPGHLDNGARNLESYSIHDGSTISCSRAAPSAQEMSFRTLLDVFRKKVTELSLLAESHLLFLKHGSIHTHELRSLGFKRLRRESTPDMIVLVHHVFHSSASGTSAQEMSFRTLLDVFRKKVTELSLLAESHLLFLKHGSIHTHELRSLGFKRLRRESTPDMIVLVHHVFHPSAREPHHPVGIIPDQKVSC